MAMPSYKIARVLACLACMRQGVRISTQTAKGLEFKTEQGLQPQAEVQQSSEKVDPAQQSRSQRWLAMLAVLLAAPNLSAGFGGSGWSSNSAPRGPALASHGRAAAVRLAVDDQDGQSQNHGTLPGSQPGRDWIEELRAINRELEEASADGKDMTKEVREVQDLTKELLEANAEELQEFCFGLPGAIAPLGQWDPAGLLNGKAEPDVYLWRESELTHGRLAMLASLGFLTQAAFHPMGENLPVLEQIRTLPDPLLFTIPTIIGFCETARSQRWTRNEVIRGTIPKTGGGAYLGYKPGEIGYYPGDLAFDPLGLQPSDPPEFRIMQEKELANGRLAMLAATGFAAQEAATGKTWA